MKQRLPDGVGVVIIALETKSSSRRNLPEFSVETQKTICECYILHGQTHENGASSICLQRVPSVVFGCLKMKMMFLMPGSVPT
jgi:hypothetical protein